MPIINDSSIRLPGGCGCPEGSVLLGNLGAIHDAVSKTVEAMTPSQLQWQPSPRSNTIGMLLTHIACAEVQFIQMYVNGEKQEHIRDVLGIGFEEEGMPLEPGAGPPAALAGKDAAYFIGLLGKARTHSETALRMLSAADFENLTVIDRPNGDQRIFNLRWLLFHVVEHAAAHHGQILTLKRLVKEAGIS